MYSRAEAKEFQSTLSLRRATKYLLPRFHVSLISIHALLAESDVIDDANYLMAFEFQSTLSLRRATQFREDRLDDLRRFQSTLSLRRATQAGHVREVRARHFNPRSPCGERLFFMDVPHFPKVFQSTLSLRRATFRDCHRPYRSVISIHALLAESDIERREIMSTNDLFQSTLSLRRATWPGVPPVGFSKFQSTLSLRRATANTTKLALSFLSKVPI